MKLILFNSHDLFKSSPMFSCVKYILKNKKVKCVFSFSYKKLPGNNQVVSTAEKIPLLLFVFNSCRRLARHVVQYAVNLLDFVDDPHGDLLQNIPWNLGKVSRHPVN